MIFQINIIPLKKKRFYFISRLEVELEQVVQILVQILAPVPLNTTCMMDLMSRLRLVSQGSSLAHRFVWVKFCAASKCILSLPYISLLTVIRKISVIVKINPNHLEICLYKTHFLLKLLIMALSLSIFLKV